MKAGKRTYRQRIFLYFLAAFTLFAFLVISFQYKREKSYRTDQLEARLDLMTLVTSGFIEEYHLDDRADFSGLDTLLTILPEEHVRITVIDTRGTVVFDNFVPDYAAMENHLMRPEVQKARYSGSGSAIRHSETTGEDFYYYTRSFGTYFVRCAMVYDVEARNFLKTSRLFFFYMGALFVIMGGLLYLVTGRLGQFINQLRDFAVRAGRNEVIQPSLKLSDSEFGDIQKQIIQIYDNLKSARDALTLEKERLNNHLLALDDGIALFNPSKEKILANSNFIHYINMISDRSSVSAEHFFRLGEVKEIVQKIEENLKPGTEITARNLPHHELTVSRNERYFRIQAIVFADRSFEILISDITRPEKRRRLKQQLTSNIAHELKTPLSSIRGYLETILNNSGLKRDKVAYFAEKAYAQCDRLNELLNEVSLLNNIEESGDLFEFTPVRLRSLVEEVIENLGARLKEQQISVELEIDPGVILFGNNSLLSSIFQNLIENSINYAGAGTSIHIARYLEDENCHYFNYHDTGKGVPEAHLPRIFERFYRVDEGRSRESGGTGLGLAIVKNAVQLHRGEISVRNRAGGGLEFLFSLAK